MKTNHFNSPVIVPLVKASAQNAVFADGDVLFDWTPFEIPRGTAKLIGASIIIRQNKVLALGGALDLVFVRDTAESATPEALGTANSPIATFYREDIIGALPGADADVMGGAGAVSYQSTSSSSGIIFEPETDSGSSVGYDKYHVGGLSNGTVDLRSLVALDDDVDVSGNNGTINTLDGTATNLVFNRGDVLHVQDDIILGEISTNDANDITFKFDGSTSANHSLGGNHGYIVPESLAAWRIQNGAGAAGDLSDDDLVYNVHPIRIILHFEK